MQRKKIFDFIPPPNYLKMPAVGVDISDVSLKFVELEKKKNNLFISRYGSRRIPKGIIESGDIKQKEKLVEILDSFRKELNKKFIIVLLPEEKAFFSKIKLPLMKEREIRGALELQLEEYVPLSIDNIIFDFEIINKDIFEKKSKNKGSLDVNVIAFPKTVVEDYRDVFIKANFMPLVFEMEAQAFTRVVVPKGDEDSFFIIDFGGSRSTFVIVSNQRVQFTSTVLVGGDELTEALSNDLNIDIFQAEEIKRARGLVKRKGNEKVFNSLLRGIAAIKEEIDKHIIYWNSRSEISEEQRKIKKILLCGGNANLIGLPEYLSYELKLPVERANIWVNIKPVEEKIPEIEYKDSLTYAAALGLALRSLNFE